MSQPTEPSSESVRRLILELLPEGRARGGNPAVYGGAGGLDSLGLVNLLADLEYRVGGEFGREIVLASERAMSRARSPFRDVTSLTEYVMELLAEPHAETEAGR